VLVNYINLQLVRFVDCLLMSDFVEGYCSYKRIGFERLWIIDVRMRV